MVWRNAWPGWSRRRCGRRRLARLPRSPTSNPSLTTTRQRPERPQLVVHLVGHLLQRAGPLGQVDLQRHFPLRIGQPGRRRDEPDLPAHGLHHQHRVGRARAGVLLVGVLDRMHPVPGHRAVAGRVVDQPELAVAHVVVDGLGHAHGHQVQAPLVGQLGDLVGRVHRVVAADVEEIAHLVGPQHLDHPLEILLLPLASACSGRCRSSRPPA